MAVSSLRVRPEDWTPIGVKSLEANALKVVRAGINQSVIAGPGAGKTELLAQRAAFLLQTEAAPTPRRILAISFKRDAASNLAARVRKRCHSSHASRFDSMTFDAFAKGLLDRFGQALPEFWRPRPGYEITTYYERDYRNFLDLIAGSPPGDIGTKASLRAIGAKSFERKHLLGAPLPVAAWPKPDVAQWAMARFWHYSLHEGKKSVLTFPMIGRLVELLLRINPMVREALRLTYSHLFMDEFQDTTQVQYDLVHTIFCGTDTVVTAVGDNKQQIMRWALAMDDPFSEFDADFGGLRTTLFNNYRSSPDLVRIQHVLAQALDSGAMEPISQTEGTIDGESCVILDFRSPKNEAQHLAKTISAAIADKKLLPRDFVVLVRQKAGDYADVLRPAFEAEGLSLRNEAGTAGQIMLQELMTEDLSKHLVSLLRLAMNPRAGRHWSNCQTWLALLRGVAADEPGAQQKLATDLDAFARALSANYPTPPGDEATSRSLVTEVLNFLGRERLSSSYPSYAHGDWLDTVIDSAVKHLLDCSLNSIDWCATLDAYEGLHAVPLMTIHKSKGLEYHTVIFVGLDDGAWWSFSNDQIEATAGFFVAFTRAKQRVIFTYCKDRGTRTKIATLYNLLELAGVRITSVY
jgi:superfamily I DNA/RNA helicase